MKSKKKNESKFAISRKGYSTVEVDKYISSLVAEKDKIQAEQRERIQSLAEEVKSLKKSLKEYALKEGQIADALVSASEKGEKMLAEIRMRYALELERLNFFRAKWTGVYEELKERYRFDQDALNLESVAVSTRIEIERFLQRDFSLSKGGETTSAEETFKRELERLASTPSGVEELKEKLLQKMAQ